MAQTFPHHFFKSQSIIHIYTQTQRESDHDRAKNFREAQGITIVGDVRA
jgi:hypothetical protein